MAPLALLLALLATAVLPTAARAQASGALPTVRYLAPAPGATVPRGAPVRIAVRIPAPAADVRVRIAGTPETDADGRLTGQGTWTDLQPAPTAEPGVLALALPRRFLVRRRPGRYWWQALTGTSAARAAGAVGPVAHFDMVVPAADRGRGRLHPRFGRRGRAAPYLSAAGLPADVSPTRFRVLAARAAQRWGLRARRFTDDPARPHDGFDLVGFGAVPSGVLGVQTDVLARGLASTRVVERDIVLSTQVAWHTGEGPPPLHRFDLESVLIHELGHMAGNKAHRARCENSPLMDALGAGEWWRGPRDWWVGCATGARAASARPGAPLRFLHRRIVVDERQRAPARP